MRFLSPDEIEPFLPSVHRLVHDSYSEFISQAAVSRLYWDRLYEKFSSFQRILVNGDDVAAVGNSIPVRVDEEAAFLKSGWDGALEQGVKQNLAGINPNTLVGLSVSVSSSFRGQKLSSVVLKSFVETARSMGLKRVLIPLRPTRKHEFPSMSFEDYLDKQDGDLTFDPWIRLHESLGGKRLGVVVNSMVIEGRVSQWEAWTEQRFDTSQEYSVAGGLVPVVINREKDCGVYREPNLWMEHRCNR